MLIPLPPAALGILLELKRKAPHAPFESLVIFAIVATWRIRRTRALHGRVEITLRNRDTILFDDDLDGMELFKKFLVYQSRYCNLESTEVNLIDRLIYELLKETARYMGSEPHPFPKTIFACLHTYLQILDDAQQGNMLYTVRTVKLHRRSPFTVELYTRIVDDILAPHLIKGDALIKYP